MIKRCQLYAPKPTQGLEDSLKKISRFSVPSSTSRLPSSILRIRDRDSYIPFVNEVVEHEGSVHRFILPTPSAGQSFAGAQGTHFNQSAAAVVPSREARPDQFSTSLDIPGSWPKDRAVEKRSLSMELENEATELRTEIDGLKSEIEVKERRLEAIKMYRERCVREPFLAGRAAEMRRTKERFDEDEREPAPVLRKRDGDVVGDKEGSEEMWRDKGFNGVQLAHRPVRLLQLPLNDDAMPKVFEFRSRMKESGLSVKSDSIAGTRERPAMIFTAKDCGNQAGYPSETTKWRRVNWNPAIIAIDKSKKKASLRDDSVIKLPILLARNNPATPEKLKVVYTAKTLTSQSNNQSRAPNLVRETLKRLKGGYLTL
ncbi:hypothetical protein CC78DRAFT_580964 [Lojkania enalia]|uniref:Uncharacterized protein n=1 Tax=Lojkania enalia TaxID=147567 RepID=A0A9P4N862_9PLEO|nr:hypothetical protein CC78DRAFT_580964 [Didymosphaeria enalia]